jgi:hypothetical protein
MSIESIRKRLEAAMPGPWEISDTDINGHTMRVGPIAGYDYDALMAGADDPDIQLIAHAPTDLALLLEVAEAAKVWVYGGDQWNEDAKRLGDAIDALEAAD